MKAVFLFVAMSLAVAVHAKRFDVHYEMQISPTCYAVFDGWVDVDMNPFSGTFLEATSYSGTVTITGNGCNPGTYPVSGLVTGSIPDSGVTDGDLNEFGYRALYALLAHDSDLHKNVQEIIEG